MKVVCIHQFKCDCLILITFTIHFIFFYLSLLQSLLFQGASQKPNNPNKSFNMKKAWAGPGWWGAPAVTPTVKKFFLRLKSLEDNSPCVTLHITGPIKGGRSSKFHCFSWGVLPEFWHSSFTNLPHTTAPSTGGQPGWAGSQLGLFHLIWSFKTPGTKVALFGFGPSWRRVIWISPWEMVQHQLIGPHQPKTQSLRSWINNHTPSPSDTHLKNWQNQKRWTRKGERNGGMTTGGCRSFNTVIKEDDSRYSCHDNKAL